MGIGDDLTTEGLGGLGQAPLTDQEGGLLLGPREDPIGLLVRLLDDPLALGIDPFGRPDLLGDRRAEEIDLLEDLVTVDDGVPGQRQGLAGGDE